MIGTMDWLRRNWPDLLIGIALVAVIAGIIATLISGGSFFPFGGNRNTGTTTGQTSGQSTTLTTPLTPSGSSTTTQSGSSGSQTGSSTTPSTSGSSTTTSGSTDAQSSGSSISVLPPAGSTSTTGSDTGSSTTTTTPATTGSATTGTEATTPTTSTLSTTPATTTSSSGSTTTSSTTSSTISTSAAGQGAPYRVSVGAFGSVDNANRQADAFRAAGYPVFLGTQGSLNIVLVGPYDTEAQARAVADRIRADAALNVTDPTVYMLDNTDSDTSQSTTSSGSSTTTTSPATTSATTTTTTTPATTSTTTSTQPTTSATTSVPATSASGRYLQVGAYGSRASSLPQRERVEGLGFVVSEREESGLIKLLIGPFDAAALGQAQARLTAAGVESFAR